MKETVRLALVGVGNCTSSLLQGIEYYRNREPNSAAGLMHPDIGGYGVSDVEVAVAFDIDRRKVGQPLQEAVFAKPNCTTVFHRELPDYGITVRMGPVLDGVAGHMADFPDDQALRVADAQPVDVVKALKETGAEVLVCNLPVGSEKATRQ